LKERVAIKECYKSTIVITQSRIHKNPQELCIRAGYIRTRRSKESDT
jgi:hypothetical protein